MAKQIDLTGQRRLLNHGFLHPIVVGAITPKATYRAIIFTIGILQAVTLGLWAWVFWKVAVRFGSNCPGWWSCWVCVLSMGALATVLVGLHGRPEPFVMLLLGLAAAVSFVVPPKWHSAVSGVALGLIAASHPVPAVLLGLATLAYRAWHLRFSLWLADGLKVGVAATGGFALALSAFPYTLAEWLDGCWRAGASVLARLGDPSPLYYWFAVPSATFCAAVLVLGAIAAVALFRRERRGPACSAAFAVTTVLFLFAAWYFGGRAAVRNYNLLAAIPIVYALIIACSAGLELRQGCGSRAALALISVVLLLAGAGFYRAVVLFPFFLERGVTYEEARHRLSKLRAEAEGGIALDAAFFVLAEGYDGLRFDDDGYTESTFIFLQQANRRLANPPEIKGFDLLEDRFGHRFPTIAGVRLGHSEQGYNYAIYKRRGLPN